MVEYLPKWRWTRVGWIGSPLTSRPLLRNGPACWIGCGGPRGLHLPDNRRKFTSTVEATATGSPSFLPGREVLLPGSFDGLLVQAGVERSPHADVAGLSIRSNHSRKNHRALNVRPAFGFRVWAPLCRLSLGRRRPRSGGVSDSHPTHPAKLRRRVRSAPRWKVETQRIP
jgi:hypothetical protein